MTVLCKGRLFELRLLGTMIDHKLRLCHYHNQLEEDQSTHNYVSSKFVGLLENILVGIKRVIAGSLDVVLSDK